MKIALVYLIILFSCMSNAQEKRIAASKALAAIEIIDKGEYEVKLPTRLACLTQIFPENVNLNYSGVCYKPTKNDLELWKAWILENQQNLQFENEEPNGDFDFIFGDFNIIFKDSKGIIRDSFCE